MHTHNEAENKYTVAFWKMCIQMEQQLLDFIHKLEKLQREMGVWQGDTISLIVITAWVENVFKSLTGETY